MRALGARPGQNSSNSSRPPSPCPTSPPASRPASSVKGEPKNTAIPGAVFVHSGGLGHAPPRAAGPCGSVRRAGAALWRPPDRAVLYARRGVRRLRLFEAPDDAAAAAVEMADVAAGHLKSNRLLRVLSAGEMHAALQQAATAPDMAPKRTG